LPVSPSSFGHLFWSGKYECKALCCVTHWRLFVRTALAATMMLICKSKWH
jgi:hypothetical protein